MNTILLNATFLRTFIDSIIYNLFLAPLKGLWELAEKISPNAPGLIRFFIFLFFTYALISSIYAAIKLLYIIMQYSIFTIKQGRKKREREIRKQERERVLRNLEDNKQFDEMYEQYVLDEKF